MFGGDLEIHELAALRGRGRDLRTRLTLPEMGRVIETEDYTGLCVRPERWLLLSSSPSAARRLRAAIDKGAELAVAVDLSSALSALRIADRARFERLEGGCRLDLDPKVLQEGHAAATIIAQVSVILANLSDGLLILTPSTTASHFQEWLGEHVK